jgi:DNA polymerase-3 subunit delta
MPMASPDRLLEQLRRGKPVPAIVLKGTDVYLRDMCRNSVIEAYVPENARDWAVTRLAAREAGWDEILGRAQTLPMMAPQQVIVVDGVESVEKLGEKAREEVVEAIENYLASPAPFSVLLLEATALDGRQRFAKLLQEKALIVELTIGAESAASLAAHMAKQLGVEIDGEAAALLADIVNHEPARIRIELEKLSTYVGQSKRIAVKDVEDLVVAARRNTVWQLADMLANRERGPALEFLDNLLREGEQLPGIVGALAWRYRNLIETGGAPQYTPSYQASRRPYGSPEASATATGPISTPQKFARRISKKQLLAGLVALAEVDSQLKSSNPNPRALMEFLVARLTSSASTP